MRRQSMIFWIVMFAAFLIPAVLGLILGRIGLGWFALIGMLLVGAAAFVLIRSGLGRRYTRDLQRRLPTPPERELIAHAKRPTAIVGLIVLGLAGLAVIAFGVLNPGVDGADDGLELPTATPELALTAEPVDEGSETGRTVDPLAGLSLPVMLLGAGLVTLGIIYAVTRLQNDAEAASDGAPLPDLQPPSSPHRVTPMSDAEEEGIDWRAVLGADEDDDDLSVWLDGLTKDEDQQH